MKRARFVLPFLATTLVSACLQAQTDDSNAKPPVTKADVDIVKRAGQILNSPEKWNRADNRVCPAVAKTFSLYCALEKATDEVSKNFQHRGAAMQEARFVIEEIAPNAKRYSHRLMDYNNDPTTTFADIQGVFWLLEKHIAMRLAQPESASPAPTPADTVTTADLRVVQRVRELLDSPAKWNRADTECSADAKAFNLLCAFEKAEKEVTGNSQDGAAIGEARAMITELDPSRSKYKARLVDYNADPAITFADLQKFLRQLESRISARMAAK
jgi:hypothetical protein